MPLLSSLLIALLLVDPEADRLQAEQRLKEGQRLMAGEKFEEAAQQFREAIRLDPLLFLAHYGLGQAQMALKQYPSAVAAFRNARESFHTATGEAVSRRLENDKARDDRIRDLRDRIQEINSTPVNPNTPEARRREMRVQELEIQVAALQRSRDVPIAPETPPGLSLALGSAYFRSGRLEDAEREYRAAVQVQPKMGEARNNLAVVLLLAGRPADALEQIALAEKNGFKVAAGLRQDIEQALQKPSPPPRR